MVTRTPAVSEGHLQPSGIPGSESSWLEHVRHWQGVQMAHRMTGWTSFSWGRNCSLLQQVSQRQYQDCQPEADHSLAHVCPAGIFKCSSCSSFFSVAEASRASVSIPVACFHKTWWGFIIFDVCPLSFQNILISATRFRSYQVDRCPQTYPWFNHTSVFFLQKPV